ncbi:hypothetical protein NM22_18095 [Vibrio tubiashii]|nr:hypothetical protein NM22_18095 [Vibrio tubiashii]
MKLNKNQAAMQNKYANQLDLPLVIPEDETAAKAPKNRNLSYLTLFLVIRKSRILIHKNHPKPS